jgi:hypothetical protein
MPQKKSYFGSKSYGYGWKSASRTGNYKSAGYYNTTRTMTNTTQYAANSPKFRSAREECQWRIGSYQNVYSQFSGNQKTAFSPTTANKWLRYINNGGRVYKFTNQQFSKFFGNRWWTVASSTTNARQFLRNKFGAFIKDVTRGNNNYWLVATSKNVSGKYFTNYTWY